MKQGLNIASALASLRSSMAQVSSRLKAASFALSLCVPGARGPAATTLRSTRVPAGSDSSIDASIEQAAQRAGLALPVLRSALRAYEHTVQVGAVRRPLLTVIDFSLPSHERRLWVLDVTHGQVLAREFVAHGRGSGEDVARRFSNRDGSNESSLGTFLTGATYQGKNGLSLRLDGLDPGLNDHALRRGIVVHGAWYVSEDMIRRVGRLGRSEGCPALSPTVAPKIIDLIAGGSVLYASSAAALTPSARVAAAAPASR